MSSSVITGVRNAKLPTVYIEAQNALAACQRIDECREWADKAAAIASYAKQAQDQTLMDMATRIKARAIRRCGELLKAIEKGRGGQPSHSTRAGTDPSRSRAARDAGLSERQRKDALRVASIPRKDFEAAVDSESPPTITELSEAGKREAANREYLTSPKPPGFKDATELLGMLNRFAAFCGHADAALVAEALSKREASRVLRDTEKTIDWLRSLKRRIG